MLNGNTLNSQPLNTMNYILTAYTGLLIDLIVEDLKYRNIVVQNLKYSDITVYDSNYIDIYFVGNDN